MVEQGIDMQKWTTAASKSTLIDGTRYDFSQVRTQPRIEELAKPKCLFVKLMSVDSATFEVILESN